MLRYNIRETKLKTQLKEIELESHELLNVYTSDGERSLLVCYLPDNVNYVLSKNMSVYVRSSIEVDNNNALTVSDSDFSKRMQISNVNNEKGLFTLMVDKYYDLYIDNLTEISDEDGTVWYFHFSENHLFLDGQDDTVFYDENGNIDSSQGTLYGDTVIYIDYTDSEGDIVTLTINCEYESPTILKAEYTENLSDLRNSIYNTTLDGFIVSSLNVYRDNPYWGDMCDFHVYIDNPVCSIQLPLSQKFETDLFLGYGIQENFVEATREESINSIAGMEKDIYTPVIWDSSADAVYENGDEVNGEVYEIQFNLHFRQHRGDDWLTTTDSYWNGVVNDNGSLRLIDKSNDGYDYFVMDNVDSQSDLLAYLNFTNDDVRYQKSKLKKSFLRLMFYDSTNPANQNLLHYSTIFMDSGKLFEKYMAYIESAPYSNIVYNTDDEGNDVDTVNSDECRFDRVGIRVDREPYGDLLSDCDDDDDIEELRLSSRFVVEDKYNSKKSSEGFYLYLWKDNDNGVVPTDIYMKVEFNHAGYGRVIPFMMPYWDKNVDGVDGIKTFEEILSDWSNTDTMYGARKYLKYSYIHFKYRYDKNNSRHVYYMDDKIYGDCVHFENNRLAFNLYEAKMV